MVSGIVKFFNRKHGFGFIICDEESSEYPKELFFHATNIQTDDERKIVEDGQRVMFEVGKNHKGVCAINVTPCTEQQENV